MLGKSLTGLRRWWTRRSGRVEGIPTVPELELEVLGLADALVSGETASRFRGSGIEADGVRPYVPGDDVRSVDWRVTARTGRPHVREWIEERGTDVLVVLDRSASLFGGVSPKPGRAAMTVAGALAAAALGSHHRAGLIQVSDRAEADVPPTYSPHQLRWILRSLLSLKPAGRGTALAAALRAVGATRSGRSLVAVVSDFRVVRADEDDLGRALHRLARRHDLMPVRVRVPGLDRVPSVGLVTLRDPETGRTVTLDTSDPRVRAEMVERAHAAEARWLTLMSRVGARWIDVDPLLPLTPQLQSGLAARRLRVA